MEHLLKQPKKLKKWCLMPTQHLMKIKQKKTQIQWKTKVIKKNQVKMMTFLAKLTLLHTKIFSIKSMKKEQSVLSFPPKFKKWLTLFKSKETNQWI